MDEGDPPDEREKPPEPTGSFGPGLTLSTPPAAPGTGSRRSASVEPTFAPGDQLAGRYRVVRFIAQGGMGEVYEAEDLALGGHVALKTIRPDIGEDTRAIERFKREIHLARKVTHPNISRIYDLGTHALPPAPGTTGSAGQMLFLTMELLAGTTLSERIAAGRLSPAEALPILEQIAAGLDAAHGLGIIHRDFKSSNVLLVPWPDHRKGHRAVITDFGLARASAPEASLVSISDSGAVVGTPAYMSPEQVQGLTLTNATDIYSLGIVVYEMLTGVRPFDGGSAISVAVKRLTTTPPSPRTYLPDIDPRWETVILRCLEREPAARFPTAVDVVSALKGDAVASGGAEAISAERQQPLAAPSAGPAASASAALLSAASLPAAPPLAAGRRPAVWAAGAVAVALVGLLAWGLWARRSTALGGGTGAPAASAVPARRTLAVLGFRNAAARPDAAWLATALSEMLTTELAAGGTLRVVPGEEIVRIKRELELSDAPDPTREVLGRIRRAAGADVVVAGAFTVLGTGDSRLLRIDLRLHDAATGDVVASGQASGTDVQLFDLVSRAGAPLRDGLGLGAVSATQALEVEASLPGSREAARLYAEGIARLRVSDPLGARDALEKAVAADPQHPMPHAALAQAWAALGYDGRALQAAQKAASLSEKLPAEQRLFIEARLHSAAKDREKTIEAYRSLFTTFPDSVDYGLLLVEAQYLGGRAKEALVTLEALRRLPAPLSEDPRIDVLESRTHQELGDYRRQQATAARGAARARSLGARLLLAQARISEGMALDTLGEPAKAEEAVEEARRLFDAAGDRFGVARSIDRMARIVQQRGDLDGAVRLYERALAIYREIGNQRLLAAELHNSGNALLAQGRISDAQKRYEEALATFRRIDAKYEAAAALNDIGAGLQNRGELAAAQKRYEEALALFGELGERSGVAITLTNLAEVLFTRGDLGQAEQMHAEALATNREIGDRSGAAYDLYRLGEVLAARGDLRVARARYEEALAIQESLGERLAAAETGLGLAALDLAEGKGAEAESAARAAEEVLRAEGAADAQAHARVLLSHCLLALGRTEEAVKAAAGATDLAGVSEDRRVRLAVAILAARAKAASGAPADVGAALAALEKARVEAARAGFRQYELEARLAQGEIETAGGKAAAGRARLKALATEARALGYGFIAARAEKS